MDKRKSQVKVKGGGARRRAGRVGTGRLDGGLKGLEEEEQPPRQGVSRCRGWEVTGVSMELGEQSWD